MNTILIDALNHKLAEHYPQGCAVEYTTQYYPSYVIGDKIHPAKMEYGFTLWIKNVHCEDFSSFGQLLQRVEQLIGTNMARTLTVDDYQWPNLN